MRKQRESKLGVERERDIGRKYLEGKRKGESERIGCMWKGMINTGREGREKDIGRKYFGGERKEGERERIR